MSLLDSAVQAQGPHRARPNFLTRAATDDAARLDRRSSLMPPPSSPDPPLVVPLTSHPYEPHTSGSPAAPREHAFTRRVLRKLTGAGVRLSSNSFPRDRRKSSRGAL